MTEVDGAVVDLRGVSVIRSGNLLLDGVDWRVGTTHALVLRSGRVVASGTAGATVTGPVLSEAFGLPLVVPRAGDRFTARAVSAFGASTATQFDLRSGSNETLGQVRASSVYLGENGRPGTLAQVDLTA